ncbi:protein Shroom4 isoform X2 [Hyperolius riggenbachi]|uniref:protein Shroom4 isoform X2 n=1 Tax=Hyperolius riggenbachi TaxID=752182 RepID=UPI0035A3AD63
MQYPTDAFSLSWHSGCETSELPMQWNPLSRHCSTDKSSSIGSMESLDQPGQNYYGLTLSPFDPAMYQNKRDSAYSSFSASSNTSDCTMSGRTDESSPINCLFGSSKQEDGRYLQTGKSSLNPQDISSQTLPETTPRSSLFSESNQLDIIKSPPQPPVRRDSLRASKNQLHHSERRRASAPGDTFYIPEKWLEDTHQLSSTNCNQCQCAKNPCKLHQKENLPTDQYYMFSSQIGGVLQSHIQPHLRDKWHNNNSTGLSRWSVDGSIANCNHSYIEDIPCHSVQKIQETFLKKSSLDPKKSGHIISSHRKNANMKSGLRSDANMAPLTKLCYAIENGKGDNGMDKRCNHSSIEGIEDPAQTREISAEITHQGFSFDLKKTDHILSYHRENIKTVASNDADISPSTNLYDTENCQGDSARNKKCNFESFQAVTQNKETSAGVIGHQGFSLSKSNESKQSPSSQENDFVERPISLCSTKIQLDSKILQEENYALQKKPASSRHRSAQMRRKSDRFATNLRNEIQKQKAQLQKSKGSLVLHYGEEQSEETDEPVDCQYRPCPIPPTKNIARLLEIKKSNAEWFGSSVNCSVQESNALEKNKLNIFKEEESMSLTSDIIPEDEDMCAVLRHELQNDWWKRSSSDVSHKDSLVSGCEESYMNNEKQTEHIPALCNNDMQQTEDASPKCGICREEWKISPCKSSSGTLERGEECDYEIVSCNSEHAGSLVNNANNCNTIWSKDSNQNGCPNKSLSDATAKSKPEDANYLNNYKSFGTKVNLINTYFDTSCKSIEGSIAQQWSENYLTSVGHEQKVPEMRSNELLISDDFLSICTVQCKTSQQPSTFKDHIPHELNSAKWTWSPEDKYQALSCLVKGSPTEVGETNSGKVLSPVTHEIEECSLLPFADRRKFFEESSKRPVPSKMSKNMNGIKNDFCSNLSDYPQPQTVAEETRRHSIEHACHPPSPSRQDTGLICSEYSGNHVAQTPLCCSQIGHTADYLPCMSCGYRTCVFCSNDLCPALLKRYMSMTHHSCHCQILHHLQQWARCSECLCPSQHRSVEDSISLHSNPFHLPKGTLQQDYIPLRYKCPVENGVRTQEEHASGQETSLKEWNKQLKINRKSSQSMSELCHFNSAFHHLGSHRLCCEGSDQEWTQHYKARSNFDLSCDCDHPLRTSNLVSRQDRSPEEGLMRSRTHSLSQLNLESLALREKRGLAIGKEKETECPTLLRKQGPPRPPPPNWEKYKERRPSHETTKPASVLISCEDVPAVHGYDRTLDNTKQGLQSLPMKKSCLQEAQNYVSSLMHGSDSNTELLENRCSSQASLDQSFLISWSNEISRDCQKTPTNTSPDGKCTQSTTPPLCNLKSTAGSVEKSVDADEGDPVDMSSFSKTSTINQTSIHNREAPSTLVDILEGNFQHYEDDWSTDRDFEISLLERYEFQPISPPPLCDAVSTNSCTSYYSTSAAKAALLNKMKDMPGVQEETSLTGEEEEENELTFKKLNLLEKKKQLTDQLVEAQELKAHVTHREQMVLESVSKYLNEEQLQDYQHYVKMTSALIVEQRELEDKIRLGEEQLRCLRESL